MDKELKTVEGITVIANEAAKFNGAYFSLSPYSGPAINIVIREGIAVTCSEAEADGALKQQYDKYNGYVVVTDFSIGEKEYKMVIRESDNKVFIYKSDDFYIGASLAGAGVKTMELPVEKIRSFGDDRMAKSVLATIKSMADMDDDSARRLFYRELMSMRRNADCYPLVMRIFRAPEFIVCMGAECWLRKKEGWFNTAAVETVKLPAEGISSALAFDGLRMSCIGTYGDYLLLSSVTGSGDVWLKGSAAFFKVNYENFVFTGKPTVEIPMKSKVTLKNAELKLSLRMDENPVIVIDGNSSITVGAFDSCVNCTGEVTITGRGTLTLSCESHSAAIGQGGISQSYGRYVPPRIENSVKKVTVDGVHLEIKTGTPNFSIGAYGCDNDVEIVLLNGGTVSGAPEALGKVTLTSVGTTSSGSTKIEGPAVYSITNRDDALGCGISADPYSPPCGVSSD